MIHFVRGDFTQVKSLGLISATGYSAKYYGITVYCTYRLGYTACVGIPDFSFLTRQMYELTNVKWQTLRKNVIASRLAGKYCKRNKQLLWVISYRQSNSHSSLLTQSTVPALLLFSVVNCELMLTKIKTIYSEPKDIFHPPTPWWQQK